MTIKLEDIRKALDHEGFPPASEAVLYEFVQRYNKLIPSWRGEQPELFADIAQSMVRDLVIHQHAKFLESTGKQVTGDDWLSMHYQDGPPGFKQEEPDPRDTRGDNTNPELALLRDALKGRSPSPNDERLSNSEIEELVRLNEADGESNNYHSPLKNPTEYLNDYFRSQRTDNGDE